MSGSTNLLSPWEEKEADTSTPGIRSFTISVQGDGHAQAIINAVVDNYEALSGRPKPTLEDLQEMMDEKVTLVQAGETQFGAGLLKAQEGRLVDGQKEGTVGIMPKGARSKGFRINPDRILDVFPGYATARAKAMVDAVRAHFPLVTEITRERLEQLPEYDYDGDTAQEITLCAFGTWRMPEGTASDAIQLIATYDRENDICDGGVLLIRPEIGFSEHGSCYGHQIMHNFGEVVGFEPITFKRALELCDMDFDEAYAAVIPNAGGMS